MADDLTVDDGDEGELWDPAVACSEFVKQTCFWRLRPVVSVERTDDDKSDVLHVAGELLAHDHRRMVSQPSGGTRPCSTHTVGATHHAHVIANDDETPACGIGPYVTRDHPVSDPALYV